MKTYLLYIRQYCIFANEYVLYVYKVTTDNIYRIIGKIVCTSMEHIKRIDIDEWLQEREDFWKERGYEIYLYREPKLSNDLYPLDYVNSLESENKKLREINHQMSVEKKVLIRNADNAYQQGLNEMQELVAPEIRRKTAKEIVRYLYDWVYDKNDERIGEDIMFDLCDKYGVEVEE